MWFLRKLSKKLSKNLEFNKLANGKRSSSNKSWMICTSRSILKHIRKQWDHNLYNNSPTTNNTKSHFYGIQRHIANKSTKCRKRKYLLYYNNKCQHFIERPERCVHLGMQSALQFNQLNDALRCDFHTVYIYVHTIAYIHTYIGMSVSKLNTRVSCGN